jgi:hypothetical protein
MAIIFGLLSSTVLSMVAVPVLYSSLGRPADASEEPAGARPTGSARTGIAASQGLKRPCPGDDWQREPSRSAPTRDEPQLVRNRALGAFKIAEAMQGYIGDVLSGQWRAMRDGDGGIHGNRGNVLSVSYRIYRR